MFPPNNCPVNISVQFRGWVTRTFEQPEFSRREIWYVDPEGRYLTKAVQDVRMALASEGLDWFNAFQSEPWVLRTLRESDESETLWGFGARHSPMRMFLIEQLSAKA
jgi:hypothetical protein